MTDEKQVRQIVREELDEQGRMTRRGVLGLLGGGAVAGALTGSASGAAQTDGNLSLADVTADTYRISGNRYGGPASARSQLESELGNSDAGSKYLGEDNGALYHWTGSSWELMESTSAAVNTEDATTTTLGFDTDTRNPTSMPQASPAHNLAPLDWAPNPLASISDVDDVSFDGSEDGVADPFIVYEDGTYYLFAEILVDLPGGDTRIALWESQDGLNFSYQEVVLDTTDGTPQYPFVFKEGGQWYMLPARGGVDDIVLFERGADFTEWTEGETLLSTSIDTRDTNILKWDGHWYLIVQDNGNNEKRLFVADSFKGNYTEHPNSPISTDVRLFRNGGRPLLHQDTITLFNRDPNGGAGSQSVVRGATVTDLSPTSFNWEPWSNNPITANPLSKDFTGENAPLRFNHHHVDPLIANLQGQPPLVVVDGRGGSSNDWRIFGFKFADTNPAFEMNAASQSVPNSSLYTVDFNEVRRDTHAGIDIANNKYVVQREGWYDVRAQVGIDADGSSFAFLLRVEINNRGGRVGARRVHANVEDEIHTSLTRDVYLREGDELIMDVFHQAGTSLSLLSSSGSTWLQAKYDGKA